MLVTVVLVTCLTAGLAVRYPRTDERAATDAYFVLASLGGIDALQHLDAWLPEDRPLLISGTREQYTTPAYRKLVDQLCADKSRDITCIPPDPVTTQGEARLLGEVAKDRGWRSVTVVTHRSHVARARTLMRRCFDGQVLFMARGVERGADAWVWAVVYESGAMIKTWLTPEC